MKHFFAPEQLLHVQTTEFNRGALTVPFENPARAKAVRQALKAAFPGSEEIADMFPLSALHAVHNPDYVAFLQNAYEEWRTDGLDGDAFPMVWPVHGMWADKTPQAIVGKISRYSFEISTGVTEHSWLSARRSAETALSGARALASGENAAFSLCRPPGHHAGRDYFGGYCYLNNAGLAAQYLRDAGAARIAILDVDYHHGNGTQQIFYGRRDVFYTSVHADPDTDFPYFLGFPDETGCGAGEGFNLNAPLARGAAWNEYEPALVHCLDAITAYGPDALVVSLGVDTAAGDMLSGFLLQREDFKRLGAAIAQLRLKTLFVFEGGYTVGDIGGSVVAVLSGFSDAS